MLEAIFSFMPVIAMYTGAMASLSIDFRKNGSKLLLLLLPVLSLAFSVSQFFAPIVSFGGENLVASRNNAIMVSITMGIVSIVLVNGFGDFADKNVERFYHVLLFMIAGSITGFLYADNLFLLGLFTLTTEIFISILKFIYPAIDKKMFNALIAMFTTGFISLVIGCLIINGEPGSAQNLFLATINPATVSPVALFFLYAGFLFVFAAFPASLLVHFGLHMKSHVSVKVFNVLFMSALYWKFMHVYTALELDGVAFSIVSFALGMGSVVFGITAIARELIARKQRRIEILVITSCMIDFGMMLALYGLLGEAGTLTTTIQLAIMLQVLVTLATKILFIMSAKNIVKIFQSDILENMEGLKLRQPFTLAGYVMGTTGTIYLGIFILDAIFQVIVANQGSVMGQVLFWVMLVLLMFTATWIAITISWIFGGKDLPPSVKNLQPSTLKKENATIAIMIGLNAVLILLAWLMPTTAFLNAMLPVL